MEIIPGSGMSTSGMEEGVISMAVGERAVFILDPLFAFKENGFPPMVPEWAVVEVEIKVVDSMGPWTQEEKVGAGAELKDAGNTFFKAKDFKNALTKYNKGLDILGRRRRKPTFESIKDEAKKANLIDIEQRQHVVRVQILHNIMQVWLKLGNMERCLEYADNIIGQDAHNAKAHFRKAQWAASKHNYYSARDLLGVIKAHHTEDERVQKEVANELRRIAAIEAESKRREKSTARKAAGAFGGADGDAPQNPAPPAPEAAAATQPSGEV